MASNKNRHRSLIIRATVLGLIATALFFILHPARNQVRQNHQSKQSLLVIQQALQNYHVDEESYPAKTPLSGAELIEFLIDKKHLQSPPLNPITLRPYTFDLRNPDPIVYTTDEQAETYSLKVLNPESDSPLFIVDSTEHHSLE